MKRCNYIRKQIDEGDKPDVLSFEVTQHISRCVDCESFAGERAGLRRLLASGARVNAPLNFDAMLKARLAEAKSRPAFSWFSTAGYVRLGAATAGLVVMVFAAQYAGLFSNQTEDRVNSQATSAVPIPIPEYRTVPPIQPTPIAPQVVVPPQISKGQTGPRPIRIVRSGTPLVESVGYSIPGDDGVVLLRGQNGSADVPMPTVSVGAQPLLYVSAGQRQVRSAGASF